MSCPNGVKMPVWLETQSKLKAKAVDSGQRQRKGRAGGRRKHQEGAGSKRADGSHEEGRRAELKFK